MRIKRPTPFAALLALAPALAEIAGDTTRAERDRHTLLGIAEHVQKALDLADAPRMRAILKQPYIPGQTSQPVRRPPSLPEEEEEAHTAQPTVRRRHRIDVATVTEQIRQQPGITIKSLAQALGHVPSAVSRSVDKLAGQGLVRIEGRRPFRLYLAASPNGGSMLEMLKEDA